MKRFIYLLLLLIVMTPIICACPDGTHLGDDGVCYSVEEIVITQSDNDFSFTESISPKNKAIIAIIIIGSMFYFMQDKKKRRRLFYA